jgi:hypothetical protein
MKTLKETLVSAFRARSGPPPERKKTPQELGREKFINALRQSRPQSAESRRQAALRG